MLRAGIAYLRLFADWPLMLQYGLTQTSETTKIGGNRQAQKASLIDDRP
jgi:hypothetical protein